MTRMLVCLITLALLLGVASAPLVAQDDIHVILPGEDNPTGGTYCFGPNDAEYVNALWHVVGPRWRDALAHPNNESLRQPLHGKEREFVRNGMTYYSVERSFLECFFVPAPIKARVPLVAKPAPTTTVTGGSAPGQIPATTLAHQQKTSWWFTIVVAFIIGLFLSGAHYFLRRQKQAEENRVTEHMEWERTHPAESGPPIIGGGFEAIPERERFQTVTQQFVGTAVAAMPTTAPHEWKVIGEIVRGHLVDCDGTVRYAEGSEPQPRHFVNEPAFEALMENIRTGERRKFYVLWACMNGCWSNMVEGQLNFVPDTNQIGEPVRLSPVVIATAGEIRKYGESLYGPNRDRLNEYREAINFYFGPAGRSRVAMYNPAPNGHRHQTIDKTAEEELVGASK